MILQQLKTLFKNIIASITLLLLRMVIILFKLIYYAYAKVVIIIQVSAALLLLFTEAFIAGITLFIKSIPFVIIFLLQFIFDIFAILLALLIKLQTLVINLQQRFLSRLNSLHKTLEWQSFLSFSLIFNRLLRSIIVKNIITTLQLQRAKVTAFIKLLSKKLPKTFISYFFITIDRVINKSERNLLTTFKQIPYFFKNCFSFFINAFLLVIFILKAFYNFLITLLLPRTYKNIILTIFSILLLVTEEILLHLKDLYKFLIKFPKIIINCIKTLLHLLITKALSNLFYCCRFYYLKVAFIVVALAIIVINFNLAFNNSSLFFNTLQQYQNTLSTINAAPTLINFLTNLKDNSLVQYKKIALNVKDYKELNLELLKNNITNNEANQIVKAINTATNLKSLPVNGKVNAILVTSKQREGNINVAQLEIPLNNTYDLIVKPENNEQNNNLAFTAYKKKKEITKYLIKQKFVIGDSYYVSANNSKIPANIVNTLSNVLSWHIDFQREINPGDSVEVLYQCLYNKNQLIKCNNLIYASVKLNNKSLTFYNYDGKYYLDDGRSAATALLRTPVDGYRISSPFGRRVDPILGYSAFHKGVDFAAPTGTPVPAAGNGIITKVINSNSYGKYVEIKHNAYLTTLYAHMNAFAKDIYVGKKVSQRDIIGYVGATGWATGPHLHYEIHFNGRPVNPMEVRFPSSVYLTEAELKNFDKFKIEVEHVLLKLPMNQKVVVAFNQKY